MMHIWNHVVFLWSEKFRKYYKFLNTPKQAIVHILVQITENAHRPSRIENICIYHKCPDPLILCWKSIRLFLKTKLIELIFSFSEKNRVEKKRVRKNRVERISAIEKDWVERISTIKKNELNRYYQHAELQQRLLQLHDMLRLQPLDMRHHAALQHCAQSHNNSAGQSSILTMVNTRKLCAGRKAQAKILTKYIKSPQLFPNQWHQSNIILLDHDRVGGKKGLLIKLCSNINLSVFRL